MNFVKEKTKNIYLLDSTLENMFIGEFMPLAPGNYVKIFIYAQMCSEHKIPMTNEKMATILGIEESEILDAWEYWEGMDLIKRHYLDGDGKVDFTVEFRRIKEDLYSGPENRIEEEKPREEKRVFGNEAVKPMFNDIENKLGRTLNPTESREIISWLDDLKMTPEVIRFAVDYCLRKDKPSLRYIAKVIGEWANNNFRTVEEVQDYLEEYDQNFYRQKRIMKALGFNRVPSEEEQRIMNRWFDEMGYGMDKILAACAKTSGISSPNFNYVNKVLENWKKEADDEGRPVNESKPVSRAILNKYFEYLREKAEKEAEDRRSEIYSKLPEIEAIDDEVRRIGSQLSKALIMNDTQTDSRAMNEKMECLTEERAIILTEHNYDMDYTDIKYMCDKCNDTGITDMGERCSCIEQRMGEAKIWQKEKYIKE